MAHGFEKDFFVNGGLYFYDVLFSKRHEVAYDEDVVSQNNRIDMFLSNP